VDPLTDGSEAGHSTRAPGLRPDYPLRTDRLILRPHRDDDLDDLLRFHSDPEVVRYVPWPVRDRVATQIALEAKKDKGILTEPGQWLVLAIELADSATVIGEVLLKWSSDEHRQGELGFALGREFHGQGLAAEAANAVLRLGFDDLGLHRITAVCIEANTASARLLQRLGFTREARLVDNVHFKGNWATQLVYALTEETWRARPATDAGSSRVARDLEEIRELVRCFFAAFTSGAEVDSGLDALRASLVPEAIVVSTGGQGATVYDVESFIAPRRALLTDGSLVDFSESAVSGRIDLFGDIAHWFGRYTKAGLLHGATYAGAGMKSIQFVRTADGWRISAAAWDDERDGLSARDHQVGDLAAPG
jgi:RimJ/RimL family protein N-acetyltransferase